MIRLEITLWDEVNELSVPGTHCDRQPPTHHMVTGHSNATHHMVTEQTAQTKQIPEFLTGRNVKLCEQKSNQHQNLSLKVSNGINLPMFEHTPKNQN